MDGIEHGGFSAAVFPEQANDPIGKREPRFVYVSKVEKVELV